MRCSRRYQPTRLAKGMSLADEEGLNYNVMMEGELASEAEIHTYCTGIICPKVRPPLSRGAE